MTEQLQAKVEELERRINLFFDKINTDNLTYVDAFQALDIIQGSYDYLKQENTDLKTTCKNYAIMINELNEEIAILKEGIVRSF